MGIHNLPNHRLYWGNKTYVPFIADEMTRNRFQEILGILHFNDNNNMHAQNSPNYNRMHKLQPLIDHLGNVFVESVTHETCMAVDEMIIPFKGRHGAKMHMPEKPVKWGYKMWCRAGISGYFYDFEVCGGLGVKGPPANLSKPENYGESEIVVMRLTKDLQPRKRQLFFDNLFSSPNLLVHLTSKEVYAVATLRSDRSRGCKLPTDKDMRKKSRGSMEQFVDNKNGLVICAWYDNRRVLTVSNFLGKDPISEARRYDKIGRETIHIRRPAIVELYNRFMGCVDKADMYLALYRSKIRTRKWYHRITFHLFSLAVVNAFVVYREVGGHGSLFFHYRHMPSVTCFYFRSNWCAK